MGLSIKISYMSLHIYFISNANILNIWTETRQPLNYIFVAIIFGCCVITLNYKDGVYIAAYVKFLKSANALK